MRVCVVFMDEVFRRYASEQSLLTSVLWSDMFEVWYDLNIVDEVPDLLQYSVDEVFKRYALERSTLAYLTPLVHQHTATHCNTLQHTATHCSTLQHTATHCNTLQNTTTHCNTLQHTATHCNTLQHTAKYYNTLQHTATHCNTLQHAAICYTAYRCTVIWVLSDV